MQYYHIHTHRIISDAKESNFKYILNLFPEDNGKINSCESNVFFSCGLHPWYGDGDYKTKLQLLSDIVRGDRVVAVGEAGLDKFRGAKPELQEIIFKEQILLSEEVSKPLIIHNVKLWDSFFKAYKDMKPNQPWILHGYRGKPELTERLLAMGFYFSFGEHYNIESLRLVPLNRMFCETDESVLSINSIYTNLSESLDIDSSSFILSIERNVLDLFSSISLEE